MEGEVENKNTNTISDKQLQNSSQLLRMQNSNSQYSKKKKKVNWLRHHLNPFASGSLNHNWDKSLSTNVLKITHPANRKMENLLKVKHLYSPGLPVTAGFAASLSHPFMHLSYKRSSSSGIWTTVICLSSSGSAAGHKQKARPNRKPGSCVPAECTLLAEQPPHTTHC